MDEEQRAVAYRQQQERRIAAQAARQAQLSPPSEAPAIAVRDGWKPWTDEPKPGEELDERADQHGGNERQQGNG